MTGAEGISFVCSHGVVMESGAGPVPSLASAIVGSPVRGQWWSHPRGREIFAVTRAVRNCPDILVCRVIDRKITYVHARLWPALTRVADRFARERLAQLREVHTAHGRHVLLEVPFPEWVPPEVAARALAMDESDALRELGSWAAGATGQRPGSPG